MTKNASYGLRVRGVDQASSIHFNMKWPFFSNQKSRISTKTIFFAFGFLLLSHLSIKAQDSTSQNSKPFVSGTWIQLGSGVSTMPGAGQCIGVNVQFLNHFLFSIQYNYMSPFKSSDSSGFSDVAVMVGYHYQVKRFAFSSSVGISNYAGVSSFTGDRDKGQGLYNYAVYSGPGLALRGSTMYMFSKYFAVGVDIYGSISMSISRAMLSLDIIYNPITWDEKDELLRFR